MTSVRDILLEEGFEIIQEDVLFPDGKNGFIVFAEGTVYGVNSQGEFTEFNMASLEERALQAAQNIHEGLSTEGLRNLAEEEISFFSEWLESHFFMETQLRLRGLIEDASPHSSGINSKAKELGNSWESGNRQRVIKELKKAPPIDRKDILLGLEKFFKRSGKGEEMRTILDKLEEDHKRGLEEERGMKEAAFSGSLEEMVAFYALVDGMANEAEENAISGILGPRVELTDSVPSWFMENNIDMSESIAALVPEARATVKVAEEALGVSLEDLYDDFGDDVPYLIYMQSAGAGVGFWDGNEAGAEIKNRGGDPSASFYTNLSSSARMEAYDVFHKVGLVESSVAKGKIDKAEVKISEDSK